jgi:hypothetical protein
MKVWVCRPFIIMLGEGYGLTFIADNLPEEELLDCKYAVGLGLYASIKEAKRYAERFSRLFPTAGFYKLPSSETEAN